MNKKCVKCNQKYSTTKFKLVNTRRTKTCIECLTETQILRDKKQTEYIAYILILISQTSNMDSPIRCISCQMNRSSNNYSNDKSGERRHSCDICRHVHITRRHTMNEPSTRPFPNLRSRSLHSFNTPGNLLGRPTV